MKKIVHENSDSTLKDIERGYGIEVAKALAKYCSIKKLDVDEVVSDLTEDGNGMTAWDKFDVWAKNTQKLDIMDNFDDTIDWTGAEDDERAAQEFAKADELERKKEKHKAKMAAKRAAKRKNRMSHGLHEYDMPNFDSFSESSGQTPHDVIDFIAEELNECDWVSNIDFDDYSSKCYVETDDGKSFIITVD